MKNLILFLGAMLLSVQVVEAKDTKRGPANAKMKLLCQDANLQARPWMMFLFDMRGTKVDMGFVRYPCATCEVVAHPVWPALTKNGEFFPTRRGQMHVEWADGDGGVLQLRMGPRGSYVGTILFPEGRSEVGIPEGEDYRVTCRMVSDF